MFDATVLVEPVWVPGLV